MADASNSIAPIIASSIDQANVALFARNAADWWDPRGASRLLHAVNPVRLRYIREAGEAHFGWDPRSIRPLAGMRVLDVGCGGGLLTEPLARLGGTVTGLDAADESIVVASAHAAAAGLAIDYRATSLEELAENGTAPFDLITAMEVVEHVADRASFLTALTQLLAPGGLVVFSTPNRTAASFAVLIAGAEYLLRLIPRGAHDWRQFLRPEELAAEFAAAGLRVVATDGIGWSPAQGFAKGTDQSINYIGTAVRADKVRRCHGSDQR